MLTLTLYVLRKNYIFLGIYIFSEHYTVVFQDEFENKKAVLSIESTADVIKNLYSKFTIP